MILRHLRFGQICRCGSLALLFVSSLHAADGYTESTDANGQKVREYKQTVTRPKWELSYEEQTVTQYRPKVDQQYQTVTRQVQVPITEYVMEPYLINRWNPFATPSWEYRYVQKTRYELRQEQVQVPTYKQEMVAEQVKVKVPRYVMRQEEEEITRRVVVRDLPATHLMNGANLAQNNTLIGPSSPANAAPSSGMNTNPPHTNLARANPPRILDSSTDLPKGFPSNTSVPSPTLAPVETVPRSTQGKFQ